MTQLRLAVPRADEDPPSSTTRNGWLSSSKRSSEVLLRTFHHKEAAEYKTQCKGTRAENNSTDSIYKVKQEQVGAIPHPRVAM